MKQTPITINDEQELETYSVTFIGDFATITATVRCGYGEAVVLAENMLTDYYGWDLSNWPTEFERIR